MKRILSLFCALATICSAWASPRSQEKAAQIAKAFLNGKAASAMLRSTQEPQLAGTSQTLLKSASAQKAGGEQPAFYIYNQGTQAFVIVSGDDRMPSVLAYSADGAFVTENLPENIKNWLGYYADMHDIATKNEATANRIPKKTATRASFPNSIQPLLGDIQYNQDAPYNLLCPTYNGQACVTGCVATAAAQIMRYWEYPQVGTGSISYTTNSLGISCTYDFEEHPFDWNLILPSYSGKESDEQKAAVANLMLACGAAAQMDYSPSISYAYNDVLFTGMIENLGYAPDYVANKAYYSPEEWMELIKTELSARRPIYYSGSSTEGGHAFVVDGYDAQDMVHVNWGWGGYCNGYFNVTTLDAYGAGIGGYSDGSYQFYQIMFVGLQPQETKTESATQFSISEIILNAEQVEKEESFAVEFYDFYNGGYDFDGQMGVILEKDGVQTALSTYNISFQHNWGWSNFTFGDVSIPASTEDGTYEFYIGTKQAEDEHWQRARGAMFVPTSYQVIVEGDLCTFVYTAYDLADLEAEAIPNHSLYNGFEAGFTVSVTNKGSKRFAGEIGLYICDETEETTVDFWPGKYILLAPGETTTFDIRSTINTEPGNYHLYTSVNSTQYYYIIDNGQNITVKEATGTPTLELSNVKLKETTISSGSPLTVQAALSLSGTGNVNTTWLYHTYVNRDTYMGYYFWDMPFVEQGITSQYDYKIIVNEEPGYYIYSLYTYVDETYNLIYQHAFKVTERQTGIQDAETAETGKPFVRQRESNGDLTLCCPDAVQSITIYNMGGQVVKRLETETDNRGDYTVPTATLPKGSYLMRITCANGEVHGLKFIR